LIEHGERKLSQLALAHVVGRDCATGCHRVVHGEAVCDACMFAIGAE
jgi:hypothetical protein